LGILQVSQKHFQLNSSPAISAVLYHRWGHLDSAKKHYEISLQLDPVAVGTKENYSLLRRKLEQTQKKDV
jgi:Tfp pilus assembly protein PilF